jgi:hypothetical protein
MFEVVREPDGVAGDQPEGVGRRFGVEEGRSEKGAGGMGPLRRQVFGEH